MLERAALVLSEPALLFAQSFPLPRLVITPVGPTLCDEATCDASGQRPGYADASDDDRNPKRRGAHEILPASHAVDSRLDSSPLMAAVSVSSSSRPRTTTQAA